jgi:type IV secretory pathway VirB6-like protein
MQGVGTTLLAPLVGLIGAVIGFYFGGQTAVQAASQATQAASLGAQTAREASRAGGQTAKEATRVGAETATDAAASQRGPQAGTPEQEAY